MSSSSLIYKLEQDKIDTNYHDISFDSGFKIELKYFRTLS